LVSFAGETNDMMNGESIHRKGLIRRFLERTVKARPLGFEAYMWAAQRVSGLVLLIYLVLHLFTLGAIMRGAPAYDQAMAALDRPLIKLGELLLIWVVFFHALNGIRLILFGLFPSMNHKGFAYGAAVFSLVLVALAVPVLF